MFKKVLIANRGEIACRVIRCCKDMGIKTVAVYSDADRDALHVKYAGESVNIGKPLPKKSYLNKEKIIEAAIETGADAIHPGYGFLAENELFTTMCIDAGIKFIGPSPDAQRKAGDKIEARRRAKKAGVPVLPGSDGVVSQEEASVLAKQIGCPLIIKASGGGGGRGMRIVRDARELEECLKTARGEAIASCGNPDLYIEKFITCARHIEIQILADEYGNYVHLGERECSIQKRHQKLIEESPSPVVDEQLRKEIGAAAIKVMESVGYYNAGTVEFLLDKDNNYSFNEINSRLQVEHPVTEMVTGIDLVRQQILIANGGRLEFGQKDIQLNGWSMECRINAEDPKEGFAPSPGQIKKLILPGGFGVRVDTHIYEGYEIPPFYDSLLGKLIVWAENREAAIRRMQRSLDELQIEGVKVTTPFHKAALQHKKFLDGNIHTGFLDENISELLGGS
jgi:acetyl-CoA carboxylase biotin carboxylase subunit